MTFDVRDKKSTFQTSCYVRRDIMAASAAALVSQQSSLDSRFGMVKPTQSRNKNRSNGDEAPLGLKGNTLLQDSLNSIISNSYAKPGLS